MNYDFFGVWTLRPSWMERRRGKVVTIRHQLNLPVKFVGLGEKPENMEAFDPEVFVEAMFEEEGKEELKS